MPCQKRPSGGYIRCLKSLLLSFLPTSHPHPPLLLHLTVSVGVKSAYSPAPTTVYNQPPPQRQVTTLKPLAPSSSVSTSYNIYPASTSVQQPPTPISSYTLGSSFSSTVSATSYSGKINVILYMTSVVGGSRQQVELKHFFCFGCFCLLFDAAVCTAVVLRCINTEVWVF